jgi:hypothetical protein
MTHPIWISKGGNLSFQDVLQGKTSYIDAWSTIVTHWMFEPCRLLARDRKTTDRGMALLMLELAFFEPLGSIITGSDSTQGSRKTFAKGLRQFAAWLADQNSIGETEKSILEAGCDKEEPNVVYTFARCGLMHNMTMKGGQIFIDALGVGNYSVTDYEYQIRSIAKNGTLHEGDRILLIDPWRLLIQMGHFLEWFVEKLRDAGPESDLYKNFAATFEQMIVRPGRVYFGLETSP